MDDGDLWPLDCWLETIEASITTSIRDVNSASPISIIVMVSFSEYKTTCISQHKLGACLYREISEGDTQTFENLSQFACGNHFVSRSQKGLCYFSIS